MGKESAELVGTLWAKLIVHVNELAEVLALLRQTLKNQREIRVCDRALVQGKAIDSESLDRFALDQEIPQRLRLWVPDQNLAQIQLVFS